MTTKKKVVSVAWLVTVIAAAFVFYGTTVRNRTGSQDLPSNRGAMFEFDVVPGPIQPVPLKANLDVDKVALGRRLFNEPRLSKDDTVACSNCHQNRLGGADGRKTSPGVGGTLGKLNSPTVFNSVFNVKQFWDGRADSLEDQIDGPLENENEMGLEWGTVIAKLSSDASYVAQFNDIYSEGLRPESVKDAIATFERSLITPNAPFDLFLRGDENALTAREKEGYTLFVDLGCSVCHQGINVGGTLFQKMGKVADYFEDREVTKEDLGRYNVTGNERDRFVFKVPGLRNVEMTAPYFHDGSSDTLADAVRVMARVQLGYDLDDDEVARLVDFLKTLTGDLPT